MQDFVNMDWNEVKNDRTKKLVMMIFAKICNSTQLPKTFLWGGLESSK